MMSNIEDDLEYQVAFLKVLADKSRLRILALLSEREFTVGELASTLNLKEPTVSHHLSALRRSGVISMRAEGTSHYYVLKQENIHALLHDLKAADHTVPREFEEDAFESKVMRHYFVNNRLIELPAHRRKMLVILKRLAKEFDSGRTYTERQVNEVLLRFNPDCATLRRELINNKHLTRQNSIYQKVEKAPETASTSEVVNN